MNRLKLILKPFLIWYGILVLPLALLTLIQSKSETIYLFSSFHNPFLDQFFTYITYFGDGLFFIFISLVIAIFLSLKKGLFFLISYMFSGFLAQIIKRTLNMPRPSLFMSDFDTLNLIEGLSYHKNFSFPSGHATSCFALLLAIILVFNNKKLIYLLTPIAFIAAISRVYLFQHFLHDVVFGTFVGIFSTSLIYLFFYDHAFVQKLNSNFILLKPIKEKFTVVIRTLFY